MRCGCVYPSTCYTVAAVSDMWTQLTVACQVTERLWHQFCPTDAPQYSASFCIPPAHTTIHIPVTATDLQPITAFFDTYFSSGPVVAVSAAARYVDQFARSSHTVFYCIVLYCIVLIVLYSIVLVTFSTNSQYADTFNKNSQCRIGQRSDHWQLSCSMQEYRWTDRHDEARSRFSQLFCEGVRRD